jgi:hypothetical protein
LAIVTAALSGCQYDRRGGDLVVAEEALERKIQAEAYSFNSRLRRQGKPTTFKLEVYQTDSLLGLSGRGYLGKGALKGWLTSDSIRVYFPATKELLHEPLTALTGSGKCGSPLGGLNVLNLFAQLPDSVLARTQLMVNADYSKPKRPKFRIESGDSTCSWQLDLIYDLQKPGWRIRRFEFDDGAGTTLRGIRERYRAEAKVALKRFTPTPPPGAVRIIP